MANIQIAHRIYDRSNEYEHAQIDGIIHYNCSGVALHEGRVILAGEWNEDRERHVVVALTATESGAVAREINSYALLRIYRTSRESWQTQDIYEVEEMVAAGERYADTHTVDEFLATIGERAEAYTALDQAIAESHE